LFFKQGILMQIVPSPDSIAVSPNPKDCLDEDRQALLVTFNGIKTAYPSGSCMHTLFELQAEQTPQQVAVVYKNQTLTYAELNRKANHLAHYLRSLGVGNETLVGLSMRRSLNLVVTMLGILKAGGAYLPLDPAYPGERLALMVEEAKVSLLLTETALLDRFPSTNSKVICIDREPIPETDDNPINSTSADNLAYVMFTSGSTGRPKGVMVEHRSVVRLVKETNYADFSPEQVFLQFAPITFDASTFEIWGALLNGAVLAIMPDGTPSIEELGLAIREYKVTTLWLTAGLFHLMVDERIEDLRPLRQLLAGGDVLSVTHVQKVLKTLDCSLINGYGPTENTTFTCCYPIPRDQRLGSSVPIGKPIANTQVFILDADLNPVLHGKVGELFIGGDGLARGYINQDQLTAERFIASPFPEISSARLYKTGDLARFLPDGTVEFLGRADNQVKIRGFRIELEEIEVALTQHPQIREAIVIAREVATDDKQLIAFIAGKPGETVEVCRLRSFLEAKLPEYMIPAFIFTLEAMPLNPNGKVDRRALLSMIPNKQECRSAFVAPETELEQKIAAVFQAVLHIDHIGVEDNFFDLGANSLQLARAHNRLQSTVNAGLKIIALFQNPTVKSLTQFLNREGAEVTVTSRIQDRAKRQREAQARQKQIHKGMNS
jgi:amino acid adenylation domain-containing protein